MKKATGIIFGIILVGFLWYFLIKPQDYRIRVNVKSFPTEINTSLKAWTASLDSASIEQLEDVKHLRQTLTFSDSTHIYRWNIAMLDDSTSIVQIDVRDEDHSFANKLLIPFMDTDFEKRSRKTVTSFIENLIEQRKEFKIIILGEETPENKFCACVEHKTSQAKKAMAMMESYPFLSSVIVGNGLKLNGVPFIETKEWDIKNDSITFNFCYPIFKQDTLPEIKTVIYKEFVGRKSLKALYNGNYISSDKAWYALLDYAEKNNVKVHPLPTEFFFTNPNFGGNALYWKAEIYMPLKVKSEYTTLD